MPLKPNSQSNLTEMASQNNSLNSSRLSTNRDLQDLNGRLANYIEKVRKATSDTWIKDPGSWDASQLNDAIEEVKKLFEDKLTQVYDDLGDLEAEKIKLQGEKIDLTSEVENLNNIISNNSGLVDDLSKKLNKLTKELFDKNKQISDNIEAWKNDKDIIEKFKKEITNLKKILAEKNNLNENLTLDTITLKDKLNKERDLRSLDRKLSDQQLIKLAERIKELEDLLKLKKEDIKKLDDIIYAKLEELRSEFENEVITLRNDLDKLYKHKINILENDLKEKTQEIEDMQIKLVDIQSIVDDLLQENTEIACEKDKLATQHEDLKRSYQEFRDDAKKKMTIQTAKIKDLYQKLSDLSDEYKQLLNDKMLLDVEVQTYRKLLEGEEDRLKIKPEDKPIKRKSTVNSLDDFSLIVTTNKTDNYLTFSFWSIDDNYICVKNICEENIHLKGFYLSIENGENDKVVYKFPKLILECEKYVTIWAQSSILSLREKGDLVAKNVDKWFSDDHKEYSIILKDVKNKVLSQLDIRFVPGNIPNKYKKYSKEPLNNASCVIS